MNPVQASKQQLKVRRFQPDPPASHLYYMQLALEEAMKVEAKPTNYCVGALVVDPIKEKILARG